MKNSMTPILMTIFATSLHAELQPFTDEGLSEVSGAGVALYTENLSIDTDNADPTKRGEIHVTYSEFNEVTFKGLKLFKADTNYSDGVDLGSPTAPITFNVNEESFPDGQTRDVAILNIPENPEAFDLKFSSYIRPILVDNNGIRSATTQDRFWAQVEAEDFQINASKTELWATAEEGLNLATTVSLDIDSLNITGDLDNPDDSTLALKGVKINNLITGSRYQPLNIRVIDVPSYYLPTDNILRSKLVSTLQLEIAPLTQDLADLLYINPRTGETYDWGTVALNDQNVLKHTPNEVELAEYRGTLGDITVKELRFANPSVTGVVNGQTQYAFVPQNVSDNVIEIQGMDIQSMKVTFHDLAY